MAKLSQPNRLKLEPILSSRNPGDVTMHRNGHFPNRKRSKKVSEKNRIDILEKNSLLAICQLILVNFVKVEMQNVRTNSIKRYFLSLKIT
jgi:hypothetical protein